jgi:hypothetical protein
MGFFTRRERNALGTTPELSDAEREFVRTQPDVQHDRRPLERDFAFANRERPAPNNQPRAFGGAREFARPRQDVPTERKPAQDDAGSMLQSANFAQVREIDILIADLQRMRETLNSEAERVERTMVEYTTFTENALQSSKVICDSLQEGLRPLQNKQKHKNEKGSSRARRKAARRLARMSSRLANAAPTDPEKSVG